MRETERLEDVYFGKHASCVLDDLVEFVEHVFATDVRENAVILHVCSSVLDDGVPQFRDRLKDPRLSSRLLCSMSLTDLFVKIVEILRVVKFDIGTTSKVVLNLTDDRQLSVETLFQTFQLFVQLKTNV